LCLPAVFNISAYFQARLCCMLLLPDACVHLAELNVYDKEKNYVPFP